MSGLFNIRKCVSLTLGFSFVVMTVTGIILYIVPKGKVAYWSEWSILGLSKEQWTELHITSMFLLIVVAALHIYYNWIPLVGYLKNSAREITFLKKEFVLALLLNAAFVIGTLFSWPPFSVFVEINDDIKAYWEAQYGSPPYGHAEESTLKAFTRYLGQDVATAIGALIAKGIKVTGEAETLKAIAEENGISPQDIYKALEAKDRPKSSETGITYLGRRTLGELSEMKKIDLEKSLTYLRAKGLDATADMRMKAIADYFETRPTEVLETLQKVSGE